MRLSRVDRKCDVAVVGSGPAGSSAAYQLAECGLQVNVFEKETLPRYKVCGGGLVYRALSLLPIDVSNAVDRQCFSAELHITGTDLSFVASRNFPPVTMTMRDRFDSLLLSAAQGRGAKVYAPCRVTDVRLNQEGVELETTQGSFAARFLVVADGATSLLARRLGWPASPQLIPALESEIAVADRILERFSRAARFDVDFVPRGYGWVFPKRGHLSVGVLSTRRGPIRLQQYWSRYLDFLGIPEVDSTQRHGYVIPLEPRQGGFARDRVLLTGDAAGLADPVTGEGISWAISSGQQAAQALIEAQLEAADVARLYRQRLGEQVLSDLQLGRLLARIAYHYPRFRNRLFGWWGQDFCEALTEVFMGQETYRSLIRKHLSLRQWRRRIGSPPGRHQPRKPAG